MADRTTVDIPEPLHDRLRHRSQRTGASIRALIVRALETVYSEKIRGEYVVDHYKVSSHACYGCTVACGQVLEIPETFFGGARVKVEYYPLVSFSSKCGKAHVESVIKAIELCNRLFADEFRGSVRKLAFLPHCLRDLEQECKASAKDGDVDLVCRSCSKKCGIHAASRALRHHGVEPYVWMGAPLKRLLRRLHEAPGGVGVLGIACVPELTFGMRMCRQAGVPVVGVPLNANRCLRWMGEFRETSFHLAALERLLA